MSSSTLTPTHPGDTPEPEPRAEARARTATKATATSPAPTARNAVSPASRGEYRPDIDGIRGAAAIMVMGFHAKVPGFEGAYIGLDLFFVVSGYVITGLLLHEYGLTGTIKWGAFYARRARRLIPAKATMLVGVLILSYFILTPTSLGGEGAQQQTARSAAAAAGFVSNFFFMGASSSGDVDYFSHQPGTGVLLHTWSLSVEEQFYIGLPLAILLAVLVARMLRITVVRSLLLTSVVLAVASLVLAIVLAGNNPDAAYYLPITRAFEFLIGVALALVARKVRLAQDLREVMGLAGVVIIAVVIWKPMPVEGYPSYWALLPCAAAALLVWAGVGGPTATTRLLSVRFLVGLGLVSYGWYLWHWPFLVLGESLNLAPPPLPARIGLVLLALGVAYLSYRYIEGLFYKRSGTVSKSRTWGSRRVMISGVLAMSCVAGLSGGALALADEAKTSPHWETVSAQLADAPVMPAECLQDDIIPSRPGRCDLVPFDRGRPTVMLWGDSHAWMYIPALEAAARGKDVNLVTFVMGSCPVYIPTDTANGSCARNNTKAMQFIRALVDDRAPLKVIVSESYETYRGTPAIGAAERNVDYVRKLATYSQLGTPALFRRLADLGADVDVVGPTPIFPRNAPLCEAKARPFPCDVSRDAAIIDEDENRAWLLGLMSELPGAVDPDDGTSRIVTTTATTGQGTPAVQRDDNGDVVKVPGGVAPPRFIDPTPALCDATTCFAEDGGLSYYFDDNHLSAKMSLTLTKYFLPSVRDVLVPTR